MTVCVGVVPLELERRLKVTVNVPVTTLFSGYSDSDSVNSESESRTRRDVTVRLDLRHTAGPRRALRRGPPRPTGPRWHWQPRAGPWPISLVTRNVGPTPH